MPTFNFISRLTRLQYRLCSLNYIVFPCCTSHAHGCVNLFSTALYLVHQNSSTCTFLLLIIARGRAVYRIRSFLKKHPLCAPSSFVGAYSPRHCYLLAHRPLQILALTFRPPYHRSSRFFVELRCFIPSYSIGFFPLWVLTRHTRISSYRNF